MKRSKTKQIKEACRGSLPTLFVLFICATACGSKVHDHNSEGTAVKIGLIPYIIL